MNNVKKGSELLLDFDTLIRETKAEMEGQKTVKIELVKKGGIHILKRGEGQIAGYVYKPNDNPSIPAGTLCGIFDFYDDRTNKTRFKKIILSKEMYFDMENDEDIKRFIVLRNSPLMFGGKNSRPFIKPYLKIVNAVADAKQAIQSTRLTVKMQNHVLSLSEEEVIDLGRMYNISPVNTNVAVITEMLLEKAVKQPEQMDRIINNAKTTMPTIALRRAVDLGIVDQSLDRGYVYAESVLLGETEEMAVNYLISKPEVLAQINKDAGAVKTKSETEEVEIEESEENTFSPNSTFDDDEEEVAVEKPTVKRRGKS